ncbi:Uncharacterized protein GBIM_10006 [Gryllus bimaculatus]|nr:Uncharacterized protein GBIM_10006 [Gryllus bimaculatus]
MSHQYYTQLWEDTAQALGAVVRQDVAVQAQAPFGKREPALRVVADLYVRYLRLVRNLDVCYDQVTQPQKRPLLRRLLDMAIEERKNMEEEERLEEQRRSRDAEMKMKEDAEKTDPRKKVDYRDRKRLMMGLKPQKIPINKLHAAATIIQKIWRGYKARLMKI